MDPYHSGQVNMFVNITGASEADAQDKLRAFRGDLNAAIDSYLSEKENHISPVQVEEADIPVSMVEDEPQSSQRIAPPAYYPLPSAPTWTRGLPRAGGFGIEGAMAPPFPYRGTSPIVTQPRDIREIPIDWRDGESRVRSSAGLLIEEIPATVEESPTSQRPAHFVTDDEETTRPLPSAVRGRSDGRPWSGSNNMGGDFLARHTNLNTPFTNEVTTMATNEGDDIEEDIIRAVIEASQKETTGMGISESLSGAGRFEAEDDDFARAVSLSLKTAEQEKALREGKDFPWFLESGIVQDYPNIENRKNLGVSKRRGSSSARDNFSGDLERMKSSLLLDNQTSDAPPNNINSVLRDQTVDRNESEEQPLIRRRSGRPLNPTVTPSATANPATLPRVRQEPSNAGGIAVCKWDQNGNATGKDEWGGLSSEEQEEAVMLEAAMFGSLPENAAMRFRYPSVVGVMEGTNGDFLDTRGSRNNARPIQEPPSPTVVAQRLLREQQDDEYLASLVADREKEERAQLEEEARLLKEAEAAHAEETVQLRKRLAEEEVQKQVAAKRSALPEEPSIDDDGAVTLMVRMPDGTRQARRFRKSEPLQCLLDFIDVSCGPLPGSYQLVRPFPRKAFTDAEHGNSFHELGLNSKYETLFLELV